jgi:hypothetical protein
MSRSLSLPVLHKLDAESNAYETMGRYTSPVFDRSRRIVDISGYRIACGSRTVVITI